MDAGMEGSQKEAVPATEEASAPGLESRKRPRDQDAATQEPTSAKRLRAEGDSEIERSTSTEVYVEPPAQVRVPDTLQDIAALSGSIQHSPPKEHPSSASATVGVGAGEKEHPSATVGPADSSAELVKLNARRGTDLGVARKMPIVESPTADMHTAEARCGGPRNKDVNGEGQMPVVKPPAESHTVQPAPGACAENAVAGAKLPDPSPKEHPYAGDAHSDANIEGPGDSPKVASTESQAADGIAEHSDIDTQRIPSAKASPNSSSELPHVGSVTDTDAKGSEPASLNVPAEPPATAAMAALPSDTHGSLEAKTASHMLAAVGDTVADVQRGNSFSSELSGSPPAKEGIPENQHAAATLQPAGQPEAIEEEAEEIVDFRGALASALGAAGLDLDSEEIAQGDEHAEEDEHEDEREWYAAQAAQAVVMEEDTVSTEVVTDLHADQRRRPQVNGEPVSAPPAAVPQASAKLKCQRGEVGAVTGKCRGALHDGLWRDDRTNGTGHVYCGKCWDDFESQAEKLGFIAVLPLTQAQTKTVPLRGQRGAGKGVPSKGVPKGWRRGRGGHLRATICGRTPPEACRGRIGDLLWRDEESNDVYCDGCWAEFAAQGLVTNMELPPVRSAARQDHELQCQPRQYAETNVEAARVILQAARKQVDAADAARQNHPTAEARGHAPTAPVAVARARADGAAEAAVPPGWSRHESRTRPGVWFWYNEKLGKAQFERPV